MTTTAEEFRELSPAELGAREQELRREQFDLRMKLINDAGVLKRLREIRKEIARLKTVQRSKQLGMGA